MRHWCEQVKQWWEKASAIFWVVVLIIAVGVGLWNMFVDQPRPKPRNERLIELKRRKKEAARSSAEARKGATHTCYPGQHDAIGLDRLDPSLVPLYDRYPWQPDGLVALLGSHAGRHWVAS